MRELVKGTIEYIPVDVVDRSGQLTDLTPTQPRYSVRLRTDDDGTYQITDFQADVDGMTALCLIDTTEAGFDVGIYQLFLVFDNDPETPRIGPLVFKIVHDSVAEIAHDTPTP
jgi:hypothetical protein